jgi:cell division transport system ATP-binding protein
MIEFRQVTVCYEPQKLHPVASLNNLSLKIERGDWVFLVGPSGAGKSSLLRLIYAQTKADSGQVVVKGRDITKITNGQIPYLRRNLGIVFQDFGLLADKTAWENIAFALRVIGTPQSKIIRAVPLALETVGLTHRAEAYPHELSGGEQQRIAIARAIVSDPPILLADEPTGNLDPKTAREIGELLEKINRERSTTIVMATHDRVLVDAMKKRVVRLQGGQIVSDQNPGLYGLDIPADDEQLTDNSEANIHLESLTSDPVEDLIETKEVL